MIQTAINSQITVSKYSVKHSSIAIGKKEILENFFSKKVK